VDGDWRLLAHGETLLELGRAPEAEQRFGSVLAHDPDSVPALIGLGRALSAQGQHRDAEDAVRRAVSCEPDNVAAYHALTDVLCDADAREDALHAAERALELAPDAWVSHYNRARALLRCGPERAWDALASAERAVQLAPHSAHTHNVLGLCLGRLQRNSQAEEAFRHALSLDPEHANAQQNLASLQLDLFELGTAVDTLARGLASSPQARGMHHELGRAADRVLGLEATCVSLITLGVGGYLLLGEDAYFIRILWGAATLITVGQQLARAFETWPPGTRGRLLPWRAPARPWNWASWAMNVLSATILFAPYAVALTAWWVLASFFSALTLLMVVGIAVGAPPKPPED
jgi:tetratricopeptide (TPR) repeat protein